MPLFAPWFHRVVIKGRPAFTGYSDICMDADIYTYSGLFFTAFAAATFFPAQSELMLAGLLYAGDQPAWLLIAFATTGNTLGAAVNWALGRYMNHFKGRKWFPVKLEALQKTERWYNKYGRWSLLCSWVPVIGDPLTMAAGVLREPFVSFIAIVGFAKLMRYMFIAGMTLQFI